MSAAAPSEIVRAGKIILSAGHSVTLLRSRNALIQSAGYQVVTTRESHLLLDLARKQHFDAVVLCNSIPAPLRKNIASDLKLLKPTLPVVVLCTESEQHDFFNVGAKVVLSEHGVSQPLLEAISSVAGEPDE
jgi:DNA-binding NarL/FixJ family response regulator